MSSCLLPTVQKKVVGCLVTRLVLEWCNNLSLLPTAASCDHQGVVSHLLSAAADRSIKDCDGYLAEERATEPTTRLLFQKQS